MKINSSMNLNNERIYYLNDISEIISESFIKAKIDCKKLFVINDNEKIGMFTNNLKRNIKNKFKNKPIIISYLNNVFITNKHMLWDGVLTLKHNFHVFNPTKLDIPNIYILDENDLVKIIENTKSYIQKNENINTSINYNNMFNFDILYINDEIKSIDFILNNMKNLNEKTEVILNKLETVI